MGYRSEVLLIVGKEAMPLFLTVLATSPKTRELCFSHRDHFEKNYGEEGSMLFTWNWLKWYDSYDCVAGIQRFMADCEENDMEDHYRFVRVGEDTTDSEEHGEFAWSEARVVRSIEW